ncbi:MAG: DUF357 domain-containing protein [Candidatus Bathyarchaeota archaeon]|nr:MAG: DUF357 domain-containing protein [Candidatus Bathyarchaeota archaeon]
MKVKELAMREIGRMEKVFSEIEVLEDSEVFLLAKSYFSDSKFFLEKEEFVNAFEAVVISWTYIDSLLHFGKVKVPDQLKDLFTI